MNEETLILFYYGELEAAEADAVRAALAEDDALAAQFTTLTAELANLPDLPVPERDDHYGRRVWARVDAEIDERDNRGFSWPRLSFFPGAFRWAGGLLAISLVAVIAFQAGRMAPPEPMHNVIAAVPVDGNERQARLLQASLVDHLEGAERLLMEISNNDMAEIDIESEKNWAKTLLVANRLYRFAAQQAGQHRIAILLTDMEPVLIELANGAGELTPDEYRVLRQSVEERDLLFKVRSTSLGLQPQSATL